MLIAFTGPMLLTNMSVWITVGLTEMRERERERDIVVIHKPLRTCLTPSPLLLTTELLQLTILLKFIKNVLYINHILF